MSVIIRLQNLAWSANALDIRQFFRGLSIPEGGVHIVGGELGDAFIAFSTDEDARQAMMHDGGKIKEMKIKLLLSSRTEMQKVIETARQQTLSLQTFMQTSSSVNIPPSILQQHHPQQQQSQQQQQKEQNMLPHSDVNKTDKERENEVESNKERKERRNDRSRSRSRDRDRDRGGRDRDRGRDRRRRDRSRSRDRRSDRGNRRRRGGGGGDRSRSRDRTRSHDRDNKRNNIGNVGDRRKDLQDDDSSDVVCVGQFQKDKIVPIQNSGMRNNKKNVNLENGIWEVPPQNQIQTLMIAPGILGAGVAALPHGGNDSRPLRFGNNVGSIIGGPAASLLQPNQFNLNGINNGIQSNAVTPLNINAMAPSLTNMNLFNRDRQLWTGSNEQPPARLTDLRFPLRTGGFNNDINYGFNSSTPFRSQQRSTPLLMGKIQELDGRRNPHLFQSTVNQYDNYGVINERSKSGKNASSNSSRFSGDSGKMKGNCIEIRNMPLNATYTDVRHAFKGIYIRKDGLKMINDTHGNRVGIAYVKFAANEGKETALSIPRYVRGSEVEICHLDESIFDKAIDSYIPEHVKEQRNESGDSLSISDFNNCVLIADLPSFATEVDIAKSFQDFKINDLFIVSKKDLANSDSQCMGYVQFARIEDAKNATTMSLKFGPKTLTAIGISDEAFTQAKRMHEQDTLGEGSTPDCIFMRNLAFQTVDRDILDFFSDIGIVPRRIHMMSNKHGSPTGECFCEFDSTEEAIRATSKHGLPLGKMVPTIELVSRNKMLDALGNADTQSIDTQQHPYPLLLQDRSRIQQLGGTHLSRFSNTNFGLPRASPGLGISAPPRHIGINRHPLPTVDYVEGFGKPGCVLSLENVPFKADIDEIIDFFGDFEIKRENVIRRYNERGMPTGDARVAFSSPSEAQRALRDLRNCKVRDRTIYMKLA